MPAFAAKNGSITKSAPTSRHPGKPKSTVESGHSMRHASLDTVDSALAMSTGVDAPSFVASSVHASLLHFNSRAVRNSNILLSGFDIRSLTVEASDCSGCRLGKTKMPPHRRGTAPSQGGTRVPPGTRGIRAPSSTGFTYFGQRVDSDISTTFPASWPHGFTAAIDFCDRASADVFYYFLVRRTVAVK